MTPKRNCGNCFFYDCPKELEGLANGLCRVTSPIVIGEQHTVVSLGNRGMAEEVDVEYKFGWPGVSPTDRCGKHNWVEFPYPKQEPMGGESA